MSLDGQMNTFTRDTILLSVEGSTVLATAGPQLHDSPMTEINEELSCVEKNSFLFFS